jgi:hypothetical protein
MRERERKNIYLLRSVHWKDKIFIDKIEKKRERKRVIFRGERGKERE